jgi:hypothetical protein
MSLEKVKDAFRGCKQLSISFDPSTYNGEETAVAVVYTSKTHAGSSAAGYCPIKVIPPNKQICAREIRMTPDVREIVIGRRQERWAAYKEGRALSSMISDITQAGGLESFCVPPQWVVRDIEPGESRMILNGVAYRLKVDAHGTIQSREPELPLDLMNIVIPLLVLYIDQGVKYRTAWPTSTFRGHIGSSTEGQSAAVRMRPPLPIRHTPHTFRAPHK